jgi:transposase-like protein
VVLAAKQRKQNPEEFAQRLEQLMGEEDGNVRNIAERTGFSRMQIYRWLKETGLKA